MMVEMVATCLFGLGLAMAVMTKGLPPIAYTLPARLAVFTGPHPGFTSHTGTREGGGEALAGLRPL